MTKSIINIIIILDTLEGKDVIIVNVYLFNRWLLAQKIEYLT